MNGRCDDVSGACGDGPAILLLVSDHRPTGSALVALRHAQALRQAGARPAILGRSGKALERIARQRGIWCDSGLRLSRSGLPWDVLADIRTLGRILRRDPWKAVIAYGSSEHILASLALPRQIRLLRFLPRASGPLQTGPGPQPVLSATDRLGIRLLTTHGTLVADPALAPRLGGISVGVPPGIDLSLFAPRTDEAFRAQHGLAPQDVLCGTIAAFKPERGHALFLRAFAVAAQANPRLQAMLLGESGNDLRRHLLSLADRLGIAHRVRLVSASLDYAKAVAALDIAVICHPGSGGTATAAAEAQSCGAALVVADQGGLARFTTSGAGRTFPALVAADLDGERLVIGSPAEAALAGILGELTDDQRREGLARASRQVALANHGIDHLQEVLVSTLRTIGAWPESTGA